MNREVHVRFWEGLAVRFRWATQLFRRTVCRVLPEKSRCRGSNSDLSRSKPSRPLCEL